MVFGIAMRDEFWLFNLIQTYNNNAKELLPCFASKIAKSKKI